MSNGILFLIGNIPQRWITVGFGFLAFFNSVAMRICLLIAITQITLPPNNTETVNSDETCSENNNYNITQLGSENHSSAEKYDWGEHTKGLILSSFSWGYVITSTLGGAICRKLGGKRTLSLGTLLISLFTILIPFGIKWGGATALIILRIAAGLGEGVLYPAGCHLLAHWIPEDERSIAGTMAFSGLSMGYIFGFLTAGIISQQSAAGWPMVFYVYGGFGLTSSALMAAFCYSKPSENPFISKEELGYLNRKIKNAHKQLPSPPWRRILRSPAVWAAYAMKFLNSWIFMTTAIAVPKYMNGILKVSVQNNGFLSATPQLSSWLCGILTCWLVDKLIADGTLSITAVRKIGCTLASTGTALFFVASSYAGCRGLDFVALQITGAFLNGCAYFTTLINVLDLTPNYASSVEGLGDAIAVVASALAPYFVEVITPSQTLSEWRLVYWMVFAIAATCNGLFLIFGSGEVQEWNDPAYLSGKQIIDNREDERGDDMSLLNER